MKPPVARKPSGRDARDNMKEKEKEIKEREKEREKTPRVLKYRCCYRNTIWDVLKSRGMKECTEGDTEWDLMWADKEWMRDVFDQHHLAEHQRVNHFRNHFELTRKDNLIKNLKRAKRQLEKEDKHSEASKYSFFPTTYLLPSEYALFLEEWKKHPTGTVWIMKPIGRAQGKGIFLFNKLNQISNWKKDYKGMTTPEGVVAPEAYIVQQYLHNPYLVGGKKFDMRIYALVTSYYPLKCYVHRSGFARFSNHRYSNDISNITNNYVHLTNVAVQKTSKSYHAAGCKWNVRNLRQFLISKHGQEAVNELFWEQVILRALCAVQRVMINDKHCFEMYGYDIILDANLKPWLLEVNASPSLSADTEEDHTLKFGVLNDVLDIIDFEHKLKGNEEHMGGFDLIYDQATGFNAETSYLGFHVKPRDINVPRTLGKNPQSIETVRYNQRVQQTSQPI
ncbi:hypothetical protein PROFUN_05313 [Planoprotostelium fungivorum]|uniref:Tubulin--tyrosine ligase-like protein 9 n=1 Tax=Planoprotostelium fungivorum TaxID=1890364 RepID=A0A2P6NRD8_9EUKA|nr:Wu:fb75c08 protein-like [Planoprotostelium fungivorum]PRP86531.1 hypothetical protein PROFUN_05313 [Planoprotostelium fungivorum]